MTDEYVIRCSRCGRERPDDAAAQGWTLFEDEHGNFIEEICAACHTAEEQIGGWPDYPPDEDATEDFDALDHDVVTFLGYTVVRAQLFEYALLKLLEAQHFESDVDPEERWPIILGWLTKLTAGQAASKLHVPEPLAADLSALAGRRNFVVHQSYRFYLSARGTRGEEVVPEYLRWYERQAAALGRGYNGLMHIVNAINASPDAPPDDAALTRIWREQLPEPVQGAAPPDPRLRGDRDD